MCVSGISARRSHDVVNVSPDAVRSTSEISARSTARGERGNFLLYKDGRIDT
jgi:hypothetical protein